jgi:hypothetical protein
MGSTFTFTLPSSGAPSGVPEQQSTNTAFGANQIEGQTGTGVVGLKGTPFEGLATGQQPKTIEIQGPPGATYAQAKAIFEQQLNSGSLDQLKPGQDVNSLIDSKGKSVLGVAESFTGKSIGTGPLDNLKDGITNLPTLSGGSLTNALKNPAISGAVEGFSTAGSYLGTNNLVNATGTLNSVKDLVPTNSINVSDFSKAIPAIASIGGGAIDPNQATGLFSQLKKSVTEDGSLTFGSFGISIDSLQNSGALKPGVIDKYIKNITPDITSADLAEAERLATEGISVTAEQLSIKRQATDILNSPTVWSGEGGANSLTSFLGNEKLQQNFLQTSMDKGLDQLKNLGMITGTETPANLAGISALCSKFDPNTAADYLKGAIPPELKQSMDQLMRDSQHSVDLVDQKIPDSIKGVVPAQAFAGTTIRSGLDVSSTLLIPSDKVPSFKFGGGTGAPVNLGDLKKLDSNLYANTPDGDLTYTGQDNVVWDRINSERKRRGLPGLADIGYPRPPDEANTNTAFGSGQIRGQEGTGVGGLRGTPFDFG